MGGDATFAGTNFQVDVAAYFAVHLLAERVPQFLDLGRNEKFTTMQLESAEPVDDILLLTSSERRCLVNVKTRVHVSASAKSPMGSITDQIARQWIRNTVVGTTHGSYEQTNPSHDRIVIVAGSHRSNRFVTLLSNLLKTAGGVHSLDSLQTVLKNQSDKEFHAKFIGLVKTAAHNHSETGISDEEILTLLRIIKVKRMDPSSEVDNQHHVLETAVLQNNSDAPAAYERIRQHCAELAERSGLTNQADLRSVLTRRQITLSDVPSYVADIRRLKESTQAELQDLKERSQITVPTSSGGRTISIERPVVDAVIEHCQTSSLLLTGAPGSGKSGIIYSVAEECIKRGHPVVAISVDKHIVSTRKLLSDGLGLDHDLADVLRHWTIRPQGVMFIDALDANRGGPSEHVFRHLIREVLNRVENWNIVASIREFDLRYGYDYRKLFKCDQKPHDYRNEKFHSVSHVWAAPLTDHELDAIWNESQVLSIAYANANQSFRDLLRTPFNLFLLADILSSNHDIPPSITVQTDLLEAYWQCRVYNDPTDALSQQSCIRILTEIMLSQHQFHVHAFNDMLPADQLCALAEKGVLNVDAKKNKVSFSHHILFDYAVSQLALDEDEIHRLMKRMAMSPDNALMIAPGAKMLFQSLWTKSRESFWTNCITLVSSDVRHFCKVIPASVAAQLTDGFDDFEPIVQNLTDPQHLYYESAEFLLDHCTTSLSMLDESGAVHRRNAAWIQIAIRLARLSGRFITAFHRLLDTWINNIATLEGNERVSVGILSRLYLAYNLDESYHRHGMQVAVRGIARTLECAPAESLLALHRLIQPDRVPEYGHEELQFIVDQLEVLCRYAPQSSGFIRDLYRTFYSLSPTSPDSSTVIGAPSRIFGMTSDRGQDFRGAKYFALQKFPTYFGADPVSATEALIEMLDLDLRRDDSDIDPTEEFYLQGITASYRPDNSSIRYHFFDEDRDPPLHHFEQGIVDLVDKGRIRDVDRLLHTAYVNNCSAALWAALLRAGKARPDSLGKRLLALATSRPILEGYDCRHAAVDLVCTLHGLVESSERSEIEARVLRADSGGKATVLGSLDRDCIASGKLLDEYDALNLAGKLRDNQPVVSSHGTFASDHYDRNESLNEGKDRSNAMNQELAGLLCRVQEIEHVDSSLAGRFEDRITQWEE